jgi:hypothetical protein
MFVTNHVLSGVVIGRLCKRRPITAFVVGFASHLALDMLPHWGCALKSPYDRELFLRYARRDGLLGILTAVCAAAGVDRQVRPATAAAIAGAVLLDADKPMIHFWGRDPFPKMVSLIHGRVQNESPLGMPNEIAFGVSCALVDVLIATQSRRRSPRAGAPL